MPSTHCLPSSAAALFKCRACPEICRVISAASGDQSGYSAAQVDTSDHFQKCVLELNAFPRLRGKGWHLIQKEPCQYANFFGFSSRILSCAMTGARQQCRTRVMQGARTSGSFEKKNYTTAPKIASRSDKQ